ncbi:unnamed protein product, partial [Rotaria magnacalcarata]
QIAFKSIDDRDTVTYNTMINAFGLNGMGSEAIQLYKQMPNYLRDEVSHICVLNACSHSGLVHEARNIFDEITFKTEKIITIMVRVASSSAFLLFFRYFSAVPLFSAFSYKTCCISNLRTEQYFDIIESIIIVYKYRDSSFFHVLKL